jgi:biotin carboxyl carrier protein
VASVAARSGLTLQVGDELLVLEAMKMETQVTASAAGRVAATKMKARASVHSGHILVEIE